MSDNPFGVLGLPARADLTDDDVRAAWRRLAAATHPDRADGGDPTRFAAAAAAYTVLRTRSGRGEALADLTAPLPPPALPHPSGPTRPPQPHAAGLGPAGRARGGTAADPLAARIQRGRPVRLLLRMLLAAALSAGVAIVAGGQPATPALIVGVATWLLLTARHDLAPPR
jgi:curved DNA-binding protein CbpA